LLFHAEGVDLVEQQRAIADGREFADLRAIGPCKSSFDVAEEFALDEARRNRAARHCQEAMLLARRVFVEKAGEKRLAGAGLAGEQHRDIVRGRQSEAIDQGQQRWRERQHPAAEDIFQRFAFHSAKRHPAPGFFDERAQRLGACRPAKAAKRECIEPGEETVVRTGVEEHGRHGNLLQVDVLQKVLGVDEFPMPRHGDQQQAVGVLIEILANAGVRFVKGREMEVLVQEARALRSPRNDRRRPKRRGCQP